MRPNTKSSLRRKEKSLKKLIKLSTKEVNKVMENNLIRRKRQTNKEAIRLVIMIRKAAVIMKVERKAEKVIRNKAMQKAIDRVKEKQIMILKPIMITKEEKVTRETLIKENKEIPIQQRLLRQEEINRNQKIKIQERTKIKIRNKRESLKKDLNPRMLVLKEKPNYY